MSRLSLERTVDGGVIDDDAACPLKAAPLQRPRAH
jgi:hypothetical protein